MVFVLVRMLILSLLLPPAYALAGEDIDGIRLINDLEENPVRVRKETKLDWNLPLETPGQLSNVSRWTLSRLFTGREAEVRRSCDSLMKAIQFADAKGFHQTWIMLNIFMSSYKLCDIEPVAVFPRIQEKTQANHWPDLEVLAGAELGFLMAEEGKEQGLAALEAANQLARKVTLDPVIQNVLRGYSAAILGLQGHEDKADLLQLELVNHPTMKNTHFQRSAVHFNLAMVRLNKGTPEGIAQAKLQFDASIKIARQLEDDYTRALNETAMSSIAFREGRLDDAIALAQSAFLAVDSIQNGRWQGIALFRLTQALIAKGKFLEARQYLDKAGLLFAADDKRATMRLKEFYSEIYEGMGQFAEALKYHKLYFAAYTDFHQQMAEEERAKQLSNLELDISEARNRELEKTNELQSERLRSAQRLQQFMVALALGFVLITFLLIFSVVQTRKASERKRKMRRILDHIDEGIVTIDSHLKVEAEYSKHLQIFLGQDQELTGLDALEILLKDTLLAAEEKSMIREILRVSLGEAPLAWELNEDKLPREVIYAGEPPRYAAMHWVPIFERHNTLQSVLLGIRDISAQRLLEAEVAHTKARSLDLQKQLAEIIDAGVTLVVALIRRTRLSFDALAGHPHPIEMLPQLHTIKGIARGLGLHILSHCTHDLESQLQSPEPSDPAVYLHFKEILEGYEELLKMFHMDHSLHKSDLRVLNDALHRALPGPLVMLETAGLQLGGMCVDDQVGVWNESILEVIPDILLHALTNSVDHGFILPGKQGQKLPNPSFKLSARIQEQGLIEISLQDNGIGLNRSHIEAIARQKNFQPQAHQEIWDVLLIDQVSTVERLSQTSGRGVGLSAIQSLLKPMQGVLKLRPVTAGQGTVLTVIFPNKAWQQSA